MLSIVYFLLAAALSVPLFKRFGLGAILGYLVAGVMIGPEVLGLIGSPEKVLHFSEIGVILLLFVIGLELEPAKLWAMKAKVTGLGAGQMLATALVIYLLLHFGFGLKPAPALVIAMALGLSSTAFAVQLMADKGILGNQDGRDGFAILLFQDLAVVPILFVAQAISPMAEQDESGTWWLAPAAIAIVILLAKYLVNPALNFMSKYGGREIMTVVALLVVLGAAELMTIAGLSAGMGAFMAGMLMANSAFRHQLEADIEPFKGLSLGLFFISIGMTLKLDLVVDSPYIVVGGTLGLMALKTLLVAGLVRISSTPMDRGLPLGMMLSQGGEFAFVIMAQSVSSGLLAKDEAGLVNLVVGLSMALTSPAVLLIEQFFRRKAEKAPQQTSSFESTEPEVMILGFGRFGQVTGRILAANHIPFTALDKDANHIEFVKRFGNRVYYGDAERRELLTAAGIAHARAVVVAVDDPKVALHVVEFIRSFYPKIQIIARAHNRTDYIALKAAGAQTVIREVFAGALNAASATLSALGFNESQAAKTTQLFAEHDKKLLQEQAKAVNDPDKLIDIGLKGRAELEAIFKQDENTSFSKS